MTDEKEDTNIAETSVPIEWRVPDGIITPFATNMTVQIIEDVFKISFFEIKPLIQLDASQPLPSKVSADYIAGVVVTPNKLSKIIEVLQQQLDVYKSKILIKE